MTRRGNAILEFALSFGLLFSVFAGVFQFGYTFVIYNNLQTAVRAGARYASLRVYDSSTSTPSAAYLAEVRNVVIYGNPAGTGPRRAPGLRPEQVQVTISMDRNVPKEVSVAIVGYTVDAAVRSFTLNGKPKVTMPYMGRFAP
ncbi:MAG: pilus assembly protein [Bryobacterales bacterium]|nr:pilus assembly protein [Bryobacteraceae bacterium]MDW8355634.1 pilus assembly protein [Bryobacterales bacterium]